MVNVEKYWLPILALLAALPGITLLLRGVVWGSDSFAFWGVACGATNHIAELKAPDFFITFVQLLNCNLLTLAFVSWVFYFLALLGIYFLGRRFFDLHQAWRLPIYVASLTPLFFIEAMRFENDFFGWTLAFIALGLFCIGYSSKSEVKQGLVVLLALLVAVFSVILWQASILVLLITLFLMLDLPLTKRNIILTILIIVGVISQWTYIIRSFNLTNMIGEEIPLVGLIFLLHIIHLWKKAPEQLRNYNLFLICLGALKSKYMFLATPILCIGVLDKQLKENIVIRGYEIPVLYICLILSIGFVFMGCSMYPTQSDISELKQAIQLSKDFNYPLYNDWGDGWMLTSLGYETKYKIYPPQPDFNNLPRPFIAWSTEKIEGCTLKGKRTQIC